MSDLFTRLASLLVVSGDELIPGEVVILLCLKRSLETGDLGVTVLRKSVGIFSFRVFPLSDVVKFSEANTAFFMSSGILAVILGAFAGLFLI
jgi:hypothetical protein